MAKRKSKTTAENEQNKKMAKRKSKTTAEFKPPKKTQARAEQQKSTEETNPQSVDKEQTPNSENSSHNASCSDNLDEPQPGQSTLKIISTTEIPVDQCCSREEKTSNVDDNEEHGNSINPPETEQTTAMTVQTPNSKPADVKVASVAQPDVEQHDEQSEVINDSSQNDDLTKCQIERESSQNKMSESSDNISQSSVDQMGIQTNEDGDPQVKRRVRKRMGMCWLGERKKKMKGGNENEMGQGFIGEPVTMNDDFKKNCSIFPDKEESKLEISEPNFLTSSQLEKKPVCEQEKPDRDDFHVQVSSELEITHETDHATLSCANVDDENLLGRNDTKCMEQIAEEGSIREDKSLECLEMCEDISAEIVTKMAVDFVESSNAIGIQSSPEITNEKIEASTSNKAFEELTKEMNEGSTSTKAFEDLTKGMNEASTSNKAFEELTKEMNEASTSNKAFEELTKEINEASTSTKAFGELTNVMNEASTSTKDFEEQFIIRGSKIEPSHPCESDLNASISNHGIEQCVEPMESISAPPVIYEREDELGYDSESLGCTLVAVEDTVNHEDGARSLSSPAALPCGEDRDVQSGVDDDADEAPLSPDEPSSPFSFHSLTDSQLKNIPLSPEDLPVSCDLEDATELVCSLTRDLKSLNQIMMDARRKIRLMQQERKPPRPLRQGIYGPAPYGN